MSKNTIIEDHFRHFECSSPELLLQRNLLQRHDCKFILSETELWTQIVPQISNTYFVVVDNHIFSQSYESLYFDTVDFQCAQDHHRGRRPRYKIRFRHYLDRKCSFLEIKCKSNSNITQKHRTEVPFHCNQLTPDIVSHIEDTTPFEVSNLLPSLQSSYRRLTLVGTQSNERVTIDFQLNLSYKDNLQHFSPCTFVEVKQEKFDPKTPLMRLLLRSKATKLSISKYCTGIALFVPTLRLQLYLPKIKLLQRYMKT
jgi:hypothetical protein